MTTDHGTKFVKSSSETSSSPCSIFCPFPPFTPFLVLNFVLNTLTHSIISQIYTKFQTYLPPHRRSTVIYGHDSRRGLQLTPYTKGLDTGCVKGGRLTALVIALDDQGQGAEAEPRVVSVECRDYRRGKERREGEGA